MGSWVNLTFDLDVGEIYEFPIVMSDYVNVPKALARINQLEIEIARLRATVQASPMPVTQAEASPPPLPKVIPTQAWEGKGRPIGGIHWRSWVSSLSRSWVQR